MAHAAQVTASNGGFLIELLASNLKVLAIEMSPNSAKFSWKGHAPRSPSSSTLFYKMGVAKAHLVSALHTQHPQHTKKIYFLNLKIKYLNIKVWLQP